MFMPGVHVPMVMLLVCRLQWSEGFVAVAPAGRRTSSFTRGSMNDMFGYSADDRRGAWGSSRQAGLVRRRSPASPSPGFPLQAAEEGGGTEGGTEDDTLGFYSEIAARLGKNAGDGKPGETSTVERDGSGPVDKDEDGGSQVDKAIYDELRARRDFGFEQDLGLELEKRNITKEAEAAKIIDAGLEKMPGITSSTTYTPNADLTPREVVTSVLEALKNNDHPYHNHGVEVFMRFLSPSSAMHGVEMSGVARYLAENRNRAFMHWDAIAYPRPLTLSGGPKQNKAFQLVKLKDTMTGAWHSVSVYLTLDVRTSCWLIESCIVKGEL